MTKMPFSAQPLPADVLDALQRGNTIEAIKRLRASSGLGLKEAKDAIDAYQQGKPVAMQPQAAVKTLPPTVVLAMQQGNKIEAIRLLREHTGLGLKEAKDAVEASGPVGSKPLKSERAPGEVPRARGYLRWLVAAGIAGLVAYYLLRSPG